jgi:hypothetical protein
VVLDHPGIVFILKRNTPQLAARVRRRRFTQALHVLPGLKGDRYFERHKNASSITLPAYLSAS